MPSLAFPFRRVVLTAAFTGAALLAAPAGFAADAPRQEVNIDLGVDGGPPAVEVDKGAHVQLRVKLSGGHTAHLEGYDITADAGADGVATFEFDAERDGRFPVVLETDGDDGKDARTLLFVQVRE
jgi:hypothetical protein